MRSAIPDHDPAGLLVEPTATRLQLDEEAPSPVVPPPGDDTVTAGGGDAGTDTTGEGKTTPPAPSAKRFHGSVSLDPARVGRDASHIAEEVVSHLAGLVGAEVRVTLEIEAEIPNGASEQVVRTVTENSRTLKFSIHGFEED